MLNLAYTVDILHQDGDPGEVTASTKVDEEDSGEATASTRVDESSGDVAASNTVAERHPVSTMDGDQTLEMIPTQSLRQIVVQQVLMILKICDARCNARDARCNARLANFVG